MLQGVHIAFSHVMPIQDPRPEGHELWQLALQVRLLHWFGQLMHCRRHAATLDGAT